MKLFELYQPTESIISDEVPLEEGGASSGVRYNTEIGALMAVAGNGNGPETFDIDFPENHFDLSKLKDPKHTMSEIKKFLTTKTFKIKLFSEFYYLVKDNFYPKMVEKMGAEPAQFDWAGGSNLATGDEGPADVEFIGTPESGISIKDKGGITLANLTPKHIGLEPVYGEDILNTYAREEYTSWKSAVFTSLLAKARSTPDELVSPVKPKYSIKYNSETDKYECIAGKMVKHFTASEVMASVGKNTKWQRVFGDHLQANQAEFKALTQALYLQIANIFEQIVEDYLGDETKIHKMLQFGPRSYFYMTPQKVLYIPSENELDDIVLKGFKYGHPDGTSLKFRASVGHPDSEKDAVMDVYVRYANGIFEANPTVRVQSLKNPEYVYWEPL